MKETIIKDFIKIANEFKHEFGFDILQKSRKREYKPNHATIYHALKNYDIYCRYNKRLDSVLKKVIGVSSVSDMKIYIQHTVANLDDNTVNEMFETASNHYAAMLEDIEVKLEKNITP